MGSIHHADAKTTVRIRKEIQDSEETVSALAQRLSLNAKTVVKWRRAGGLSDAGSGPKSPRSTVLTAQEEQMVCEFRRQSKLPLDDVFVALRERIAGLTRSNTHRCLKRHGLSRLPKDAGAKKEKQPFKHYPIGYVHVDITEIRLEALKLYLFAGIDRVCKYVYVELHEQMTQAIAVSFLRQMIKDFPFVIHRLPTDNGSQFTYALLAQHLRPKDKIHPFDALCKAHDITHKLTKFRHPWTNGQVEVFNRVVKNYTTKTGIMVKNLSL